MIKQSVKIKPAPHFLTLILCALFAILYGVWLLPHTVFVRHTCMILGATLSLWVIFPNWRLFLQKRALPIWLIALLFVWVTIHLFFIGKDFDAQWFEYRRIWKKIAISSIFAIGLGIGIASQANDIKKTKSYWQIIYMGFQLPIIIYFVKLLATYYYPQWHYHVPKYLFLSPDHMGNAFGVSRAIYVFYFLPAMAIGIGLTLQLIKIGRFNLMWGVSYMFITPCALLIFYLEKDRFGVLLGLLLILLMVFLLVKDRLRMFTLSKVLILSAFLFLSIFIILKSIRENPTWTTLMIDAKVAVQFALENNWRPATKGLPFNELGIPVSESNYVRLAWAISGGYLLANNPLGYGKLSLSFGALAKNRWPDLELSWSHSAWLDFALGYGMPGFLLLFLASVLAWHQSKGDHIPWMALGRWGLSSMMLVFLVKEVSSEIPVNTLIFMIIWVSSMSLGVSKLDLFPRKN